MKTARFWVYVNSGPVKISLQPNQHLTHEQFCYTEEGWERCVTSWEFDSESAYVTTEWCNDGRDCDGRLTTTGEAQCHLNDLKRGRVASDWAIAWPAWAETAEPQTYDEFAVAAGY